MQLFDITPDTASHYTLKENEKKVFVLFNREGKITFDLTKKGAEAHIFAFHVGKGEDIKKLEIVQKHSAPSTLSAAYVKSVLYDKAEFNYEGLVHITQTGNKADASQESRSLLLSKEAKSLSKPALEILAHDVKCRHAATTSPLNKEALFFAQTRGLSEKDARKLLLHGFFNEALDKMKKLEVNTESVEKQINRLLI